MSYVKRPWIDHLELPANLFFFWLRWNVSGPLVKLGTPSKLQKVELVGTDSSSKKVRLGKRGGGG